MDYYIAQIPDTFETETTYETPDGTPIFATEQEVSLQDYVIKTVIDNASGVGLGVIITMAAVVATFKYLGGDKAFSYIRQLWEKQVDNLESLDDNVEDIKKNLKDGHLDIKKSFEDVNESQRNILYEVKAIKEHAVNLEREIKQNGRNIRDIAERLDA